MAPSQKPSTRLAESSSASAISTHKRMSTLSGLSNLLRFPSSGSTPSRSRRGTNPTATPVDSSPSATPTATTPSTTTPSSYFALQSAPSPTKTHTPGKELRSPGLKRPPASFSAHGIDNSRGPPVALLTRGNSDIARRPLTGLPSSADDINNSSSTSTTSSSTTPSVAPQHTMRTSARPPVARTASGTDEDLFLNIAEDSDQAAAQARQDRLRSRIARANNRHSTPSALHSHSHSHSPSPASSTFTPGHRPSPSASRIPSAIDTRSPLQSRRASLLPASSRLHSPQSPASPASSSIRRTRLPELSSKPSFNFSSKKDAELSPREFLASISSSSSSIRRPSYPETLQTPPKRASTYAFRPSNLHHYSVRDDTTRDEPKTPLPQPDTNNDNASQHDGTESHASTGPAVSVWDELDELKTRIRKIELGGKIPATSGAIVSQASADRPRTANTSATTVSSSPNQLRRSDPSPASSIVGTSSSNKIQPLLRDALAKAKQHTTHSVYRTLEATVSEALAMAELASNAPQGSFQGSSSMLNGTGGSDRQLRRKADNICRSLTELCIAMCDGKSNLTSPATRLSTSVSRRPSVQINGESPTVRDSTEREGSSFTGISPSRALTRIEARRSSMLAASTSGSQRESSQEPPGSAGSQPRGNRSSTGFHRTRQSVDEDDDDDPTLTLRAPSRAMTDFRAVRNTDKFRHTGRQYTSQEPMPELQPSPALRRPTMSGSNENSLLFRDSNRRYYDIEREGSPSYEKQLSSDMRRVQLGASRNMNRNSIGAISDLNRSGSLSRPTLVKSTLSSTLGKRRARGLSTGE